MTISTRIFSKRGVISARAGGLDIQPTIQVHAGHLDVQITAKDSHSICSLVSWRLPYMKVASNYGYHRRLPAAEGGQNMLRQPSCVINLKAVGAPTTQVSETSAVTLAQQLLPKLRLRAFLSSFSGRGSSWQNLLYNREFRDIRCATDKL